MIKTQLSRPAEVAIDCDANQLDVADGYGNRRVIVFDASLDRSEADLSLER